MDYKAILRIAPVIQSASLLNDTVKFSQKKKKRSGDYIKQGTRIIVGSSLIKAESELIG